MSRIDLKCERYHVIMVVIDVHHRRHRWSVTVIKAERIVALIFAGLEIIIHGGAIWGWPSYAYILKKEGFFSNLCHTGVSHDEGAASVNDNTTVQALTGANYSAGGAQIVSVETEVVTAVPEDSASPLSVAGCNDQDAMIQLIFTVAMGTYLVCSCWLMNIIDRFGIRFARIFVFIGCLISYILFAVATPANPLILFPAMTILTSCGCVLLTMNLQVGNLFGRGKATVIAWLNGCLSASVIVFYIVKVAHETGIPSQHSFYFLAGSTSLMLVNTILMPKKRIPWPLPEDYRLGIWNVEFPLESNKNAVVRSQESKPLNDDHGKLDENCSMVETRYPENETKTHQNHFHDTQKLSEMLKRQRYPSFRSCVSSPLFWLMVLWFSALQLNITFMFGTFNPIITRLAGGNMAIVSGYTDIFLLLQTIPVFLSQPLGLLMDRNKLQICRKNKGFKRGPYDDLKDTCLPLALTTIASIGYSAFLTVPHLQVQYVTFTLVLIVMSVLWGYLAATTAIIFPMKILATLVGSFRSLAGLVSFLQFPLFRIMQYYLNNDPFYVFMGLIAVDLMTFALPIYIWYFVRKHTSTSQCPISEPVNV